MKNMNDYGYRYWVPQGLIAGVVLSGFPFKNFDIKSIAMFGLVFLVFAWGVFVGFGIGKSNSKNNQ